MSSLFWKYPGQLNGRIAPIYADPQGVLSVYYYGAEYYYSYTGAGYELYTYDYSTEQGHVFVLGEDTGHYPDYRFVEADTSEVYQASIDLTGIDVIYFCWRFNTKQAMIAEPVTIVNNGPCRFLETGLVVPWADALTPSADQIPGIQLPAAATVLFARGYQDMLVQVSGTVSNNGTFRISGVPWNQGRVQAIPTGLEVLNGRVAVLENAVLVNEEPALATVKVLGERWVGRAYVDAIQRAELYERPGRAWQRNYMALHTSKLTGVHTVKFRLALETVA